MHECGVLKRCTVKCNSDCRNIYSRWLNNLFIYVIVQIHVQVDNFLPINVMHYLFMTRRKIINIRNEYEAHHLMPYNNTNHTNTFTMQCSLYPNQNT